MSATEKALSMIDYIKCKINKIREDDEEFKRKIAPILHTIHRRALRSYMPNILSQLDESIQKAQQDNKARGLRGQVRVGRIATRFEKGKKFPITEGYMNIVVTSHNTTKLGAKLSPYVLSDKRGRLMENLWQFAKAYAAVPKVKATDNCCWNWKSEIHIVEGELQPAYWEWRKAGMECKDPVRYPVGFQERHNCRYALWPVNFKMEKIDDLKRDYLNDPYVEMEELNYVEARKKIYCPLYMYLAKQSEEFKMLSQLLDEGYNLQILDVDGPKLFKDHTGKAVPPYELMREGVYGETEVGSIPINEYSIKKMLHDTTQAFGHGYALATALLGHEEWIA